MKILVAVKRVVDANVKVRVKADGGGVDVANEIAVEAAVRLNVRATDVRRQRDRDGARQ
ncbi:electron transfer flavoprotein beta-subunit (fragment) [Paraburkholderia ribeironis]|uniref:Electron transfer flavoprotein beta-subunit n=1 Tax=Paraburkholderia ribeironis TaxID=1247936 RepID=A0A1N7RR51_9BURK